MILNPKPWKPGPTVWHTPRYAKAAPTPLILERKGKLLRFRIRDSVYWYGLVEGEDWHRSYAAAVRKAHENRDAWLREMTAKAAEIAALPPILDRAA